MQKQKIAKRKIERFKFWRENVFVVTFFWQLVNLTKGNLSPPENKRDCGVGATETILKISEMRLRRGHYKRRGAGEKREISPKGDWMQARPKLSGVIWAPGTFVKKMAAHR